MLRLKTESTDLFDEESGRFVQVPGHDLELEHSLFSLSKWESEFEKPFLSSNDKTSEELMGYAYHMIITPGVDREVIYSFTQDDIEKINNYVSSAHTATTFSELPSKTGRGEVITSELIYYWLVAFNIPFECQHWHLNRLFALIRICHIKNQPQKKMSKHEIAMRNRELNAKRRQELGTKG